MNLSKEILIELRRSRREAEMELGFMIPDDIAREVLEICKRKLIVSGMDKDYLPLLYRYELPLKVQGSMITTATVFGMSIKEANKNVFGVYAQSMPCRLPE